MKKRATIKRVGIISKPTGRHFRSALRQVVDILHGHGIETVVDTDAVDLPGTTVRVERADVVRRADVVVVVGGDGTFLAAARSIGPGGPPVVGINLGTLGFLTEASRPELETALETVIRGEAEIERRLMLAITVHRNAGRPVRYRALNDVVVNKSALARLVDLHLEIDGRPVNSYRSDGLIIATPTGSTAYSLSAGGPLMHPAMEAIIVTPICPHALVNRPLVVPSSAQLTVRRLSREEAVYLTVDGQIGGPLEPGDRLEVRRNRYPLKLLRPFPRTFYDTVKTKLKWG